MKSLSSSSQPSNARGPKDLYEVKRAAGDLLVDSHQAEALTVLDNLYHALTDAPDRSLLGLFTKPKNFAKSVYLWGGVGRGKTMLMDLFHQSLPHDMPKARWHFHAFMLQVHDYMHQAQKDGGARALDDVLVSCADHYAASLKVLCFDELVVRDVADAMLLSRLFGRMIEKGVTLVFTSNTAPKDLYSGGWQRERFMPFIALIEQRFTIVELDGARDFRTRNLDSADLYLTPLGTETTLRLQSVFETVTSGASGMPMVMLVKGHQVNVPRAAGKTAWFTFADLCAKPLAAIDYLALCEKFDTFLIDEVPVMGEAQRNEAKRFIALIDALYDTRRRLIVAAAADPGDLQMQWQIDRDDPALDAKLAFDAVAAVIAAPPGILLVDPSPHYRPDDRLPA